MLLDLFCIYCISPIFRNICDLVFKELVPMHKFAIIYDLCKIEYSETIPMTD